MPTREAFEHGLYLTKCFHETAGLLAAAGVDFAPLKGMSHLVQGTYPDETCRAMADLDLFIAASDYPKARTALAAAGCLPAEPPLRGGVMKNHGQEVAFRRPDGVEIDLHHRFFPWYEETHLYKIQSREMFASARRGSWKGIPMRFLVPEDEFYYALLSLEREPGAGRYALDADAIVRARYNGLDWDKAARYLADSPLRGRLSASVRSLGAKLGTPFPRGWLDRLPTSVRRASGSTALSRLLSAGTWEGRAAIVGVFLKWQFFKRFGWFTGYFISHNNPCGKME